MDLVEMLLAEGCAVSAYDPAAMKRAQPGAARQPQLRYADRADDARAGRRRPAHPDRLGGVCRAWTWTGCMRRMRYPIVIDGRNLYDPLNSMMETSASTYLSIGRTSGLRRSDVPAVVGASARHGPSSRRSLPEPRDFWVAPLRRTIGRTPSRAGRGQPVPPAGLPISHLKNEPRFLLEERDICAALRSRDSGRCCTTSHRRPARRIILRLGVETLLVGSAGTLNTLEIAKEIWRGISPCVYLRALR